MTRDWDTPPTLRGRTFLVAEHGAIEQAARDATAWLPEPGKLWDAKEPLPDDDTDRWPVGVCVLIWLGLLVPLWAGIIALVLLVVRL